MKFIYYPIFGIISAFLLYFTTEYTIEVKSKLQVHLDFLCKISEIPNDYKEEISYLRDSCPKKELVKLMNHDKPIIRAFSYLAILERKDIDCFTVLKNNLNDTAQLTYWYFNDAANSVQLADFYISKTLTRLSNKQKIILIDLILFKHSYLQHTNWILEEISPQKKYYNLIKRMLKRKGDHCNKERIAYALSKFQQKTDFEEIKRIIKKSKCDFLTFRIIENWPERNFFVILQDHFHNKIWHKSQSGYNDHEDYAYALASFKNQEALKILEKLIEPSTYKSPYYKDGNKEFVFKAIRYYYCPLYKDLFNKLKKEVDTYIVDDTDLRFERSTLSSWQYVDF